MASLEQNKKKRETVLLLEGTSGREAKSSLVAQIQCTLTEAALNCLPLSQAICM